MAWPFGEWDFVPLHKATMYMKSQCRNAGGNFAAISAHIMRAVAYQTAADAQWSQAKAMRGYDSKALLMRYEGQARRMELEAQNNEQHAAFELNRATLIIRTEVQGALRLRDAMLKGGDEPWNGQAT